MLRARMFPYDRIVCDLRSDYVCFLLVLNG